MIAIIILFVVAPATVLPQTLHVVVSSGMTFTPADLTINVGDTVRWNNQGGYHNVMSDDGSFTSGPASTSAWTYNRVFTSAGDFRYYCVAHGSAGGVGMSGIIRVTNISSVSTNNADQPDRFNLEQNYPNPFNPSTKIRYDLPQNSHVSVTVFNILGVEIATLINGEESAGQHEINFNAENLPSGIYLYRIQAGTYVQTKKMSLMK
jgi:plastocyanin